MSKRATRTNPTRSFKEFLPSEEHRRHIRLFTKCTLTDEEDVAIRCWVMFRQYRHDLEQQR